MLATIRAFARLGVYSSIPATALAYILARDAVPYCIAAAIVCGWAWFIVRAGWRSEVERTYAALFEKQGKEIERLGAALKEAGIHKDWEPPRLDLKFEQPGPSASRVGPVGAVVEVAQ